MDKLKVFFQIVSKYPKSIIRSLTPSNISRLAKALRSESPVRILYNLNNYLSNKSPNSATTVKKDNISWDSIGSEAQMSTSIYAQVMRASDIEPLLKQPAVFYNSLPRHQLPSKEVKAYPILKRLLPMISKKADTLIIVDTDTNIESLLSSPPILGLSHDNSAINETCFLSLSTLKEASLAAIMTKYPNTQILSPFDTAVQNLEHLNSDVVNDIALHLIKILAPSRVLSTSQVISTGLFVDYGLPLSQLTSLGVLAEANTNHAPNWSIKWLNND